jgi:hypothetical protein
MEVEAQTSSPPNPRPSCPEQPKYGMLPELMVDAPRQLAGDWYFIVPSTTAPHLDAAILNILVLVSFHMKTIQNGG